MRILVKFAYLGWKYTGFQRGNGSASVEDAILEAIDTNHLGKGFRSAARTDRGVSAAGNVFSLDTEYRPSRITGILNSQVRDMVFHHYATVPDLFDCRKCLSKQYTYYLDPGAVDVPSFRERLARFQGNHDFSSFCRRDGRNTVRSIDSIEVATENGLVRADFHSRGFLWNQIRSIVAFAASPDRDLPLDPFDFKGRFPYLWGTDGLFLTDITYENVSFHPSVSRKSRANLSRMAIRNYADHSILRQLAEVSL